MKSTMRFLMWAVFGIYCAFLVIILFVDMRSDTLKITMGEYIKTHTNFIPFATVADYIRRMGDSIINTDTVVKNLLGNLLLFFPMGLALPCLFKGMRSFKKILLTLFLIVLCVELIQLFLRFGSFDIDDFILNILGGLAAFGIWKIKPINKLLNKGSSD